MTTANSFVCISIQHSYIHLYLTRNPMMKKSCSHADQGKACDMLGARKCLVGAFTLFHWVCVLIWIATRMVWNVGGDQPGVAPRCVENYLLATGHWQFWNMFAPPPGKKWQNSRIWIEASVEMTNGSRLWYSFPEIQDIGTSTASKMAVLKYHHRILEPHNEKFRSDLARYIARQVATPDKQPFLVSLAYCLVPMPQLDSSIVSTRASMTDYTALLRRASPTTRRVFYRFDISQVIDK